VDQTDAPGDQPIDDRARTSVWHRAVSLADVRDRVRRRLLTLIGGIRLRLVWWFIVVMAIATVASVVIVRQVLVQRLDERIDAELRQEVDEIRRLAIGNDPETGEPFRGRVDRIFDVFLERNIPAPYETHLTYLDGAFYRGSASGIPGTIDQDPDLGPSWSHITEPLRGRTVTASGEIDYIAVPLRVDGAGAGVFVVVSFREPQQSDTDAASLAAAIVGFVMLVIGSVLAVWLAERILAPVRLVTRTARAISDTDLSRRIPARGYDEISELSATFNDMLERLESAFDTQRRFIDDAGHELRTPITVIRGHLELIDADPADRTRTLALVAEELERMSRLVDDMLTLARAERPDFLRPRLTDIDELTVRMFENARGLAGREWHLDGVAASRAVVDEQRLMQAVLQLAANAVRYTEDGADIAVGSAIAGDELRFYVRDSGPGVLPEERDRIFERFYRGDAGARRSDGAGLGLAIVSAIAEAHDGRVELDSEFGHGAMFTIVVPIREDGE